MHTKLIPAALLAGASILTIAAQSASAAEATPLYVVLPAHGAGHRAAPGHRPAALETWAGKIKYQGSTYGYTMVGKSPLKSDATSTVTVYLIPVKLVYGANNGNMTFDPLVDQQNGVSIMQNLLNSPLFGSLDWSWGGTDFGNTQYLDAFQRGSFWKDVSGKNPNYHVVLAPTVLSEVSLTVTAQQGKVENNPFGAGKVGTLDINVFDSAVQGWLAQFSQINPGVLPVLVTDNIFLTSGGGCCIGGYATAENNGQTYLTATYVTAAGSFSEDISGFSHELGGWLDNPLLTSTSPCGALDVAGPTGSFANYGTFPVTYGGVTWHPQALAWLEYFGAKKNFSGNNWLDDQHLLTSVCQNGQ
jgi:hypothetical protein